MDKKQVWLPYLAGIGMAGIFGLTFIFTKWGLEGLTPMVLLAYRFAIAALVLTVLYLLKIVKLNYKEKPIKGVIVLSIFYPVLSFTFETIGIQYTSSSQAGIMVSLMPIFVMILSIVFLKEKTNNIQKIFVFSSVFGVIITVWFSNAADKGSMHGLVLLIISIIAGSIYTILSRKYSKFLTSIEITFVMVWMGAIFFTSVSFVQGIMNNNLYEIFIDPLKMKSVLITIVYLSVFASVIAFFAMNYMLSKLPAVNASVFTNLATIIAILAGVLIGKENLYLYQIIGGLFIILGVWGTNYFEIRNDTAIKKTMPESSQNN